MVIEFKKPGVTLETVTLMREGNQIVSLLGPDLQAGIGGFGDLFLLHAAGEQERIRPLGRIATEAGDEHASAKSTSAVHARPREPNRTAANLDLSAAARPTESVRH